MQDPKEVYQQRYETFRHLDGLRWYMMQIGIAAGSIILAFGKAPNNHPGWWAWIAVGVILILTGVAMIRIGSGIKANAEVLAEAGEMIGDSKIPVPQSKWGGVAFSIAITMIAAGAIAIIFSLYQVACVK